MQENPSLNALFNFSSIFIMPFLKNKININKRVQSYYKYKQIILEI